MNANGKDKVLKTFDFYSEQKPHWKIYYGLESLQGNLAASTEVFPGTLDKTLSRKRLVETLDLLPAGDYLIQFKDFANSTKNIINTRFELGYDTNQSNGQANLLQPSMKGYMDAETHNNLMAAQRKELEAENKQKELNRQLQEVRMEMKDLRDGKGQTGMGKFIPEMKEIVAMVQGMIGNGTPPVNQPIQISGPKAEDGDGITRPQYFKKLYDKAITELFRSEGEGIDGNEKGIILLWCLNEFRKESPEQYAVAKAMILQQAKKLSDDGSTETNPDQE